MLTSPIPLSAAVAAGGQHRKTGLLLVIVGTVLVAVTAAATLVAFGHLHLLRSAGLNGKAPANAAAVKSLIDTLTENWTWLIGTGLGGLLALFLGLLMFGSKNAPEMLFKIAGGIFGLIIVVPAVLQ